MSQCAHHVMLNEKDTYFTYLFTYLILQQDTDRC